MTNALSDLRTTDKKARISLPKSFASSRVLVEQVSESEVRIRKVKIVPEDEVRFYEELPLVLSDRDREIFFAALDSPPRPIKALKQAMAKYRRRNGRQLAD